MEKAQRVYFTYFVVPGGLQQLAEADFKAMVVVNHSVANDSVLVEAVSPFPVPAELSTRGTAWQKTSSPVFAPARTLEHRVGQTVEHRVERGRNTGRGKGRGTGWGMGGAHHERLRFACAFPHTPNTPDMWIRRAQQPVAPCIRCAAQVLPRLGALPRLGVEAAPGHCFAFMYISHVPLHASAPGATARLTPCPGFVFHIPMPCFVRNSVPHFVLHPESPPHPVLCCMPHSVSHGLTGPMT